jgi:signal transduction histidine kinase
MRLLSIWSDKVIFVFLAIVILLAILLAASVYSVFRISDNVGQLRNYELPIIEITEEIRQGINVEQVYLLNFLLSADSLEKDFIANQIQAVSETNDNRLQNLKYVVDKEEDLELLGLIIQCQRDYRGYVNNVLKERSGMIRADAGLEHAANLQKYFNKYRLMISKFSRRNIKDTMLYIDNFEAGARKAGMAVSAVIALVLITCFLLAYILTQYGFKQKETKDVLERQIRKKEKAEQEIRVYAEELKDINKRKNQLISVLSHDLRSPATGLLGTVQFLNSNVDSLDKTDIKKFTEIINNAAARLLEQLNETLQWVKTQTTREVFNPIPVNVNSAVAKIEKLLEENLIQKNIALQNHVEPTYNIYADVNMVNSIFQNIISNSIKFTPKDGSITIRSKDLGEYIEVVITDTGIGMSEEIRNKLTSGELSSEKGTEGESGSGVGLSITREFILKCGGEIFVESEAGKGTSFILKFKKYRENIC